MVPGEPARQRCVNSGIGVVAHAPAAARNAAAILDVLGRELPVACRLIEFGSGTGLHAAKAHESLAHIDWQVSEIPAALPTLKTSLAELAPSLGEKAIALDVDDDAPELLPFDAAFSCNTAHIMPSGSVQNMFRRVREMTTDHSAFLLYGPFTLEGRYTSPGNAQFDEQLRSRRIGMGLRDLEQLDEFAGAVGFSRSRLYAMPSNNFMVVWRRAESPARVSPLSD